MFSYQMATCGMDHDLTSQSFLPMASVGQGEATTHVTLDLTSNLCWMREAIRWPTYNDAAPQQDCKCASIESLSFTSDNHDCTQRTWTMHLARLFFCIFYMRACMADSCWRVLADPCAQCQIGIVLPRAGSVCNSDDTATMRSYRCRAAVPKPPSVAEDACHARS